MNTKFIKLSLLLFALLQYTAVMAQKNIFGVGNVTLTSAPAPNFGTLQALNNENLSDYCYFSKPASNLVEIKMEGVRAEKLVDYSITFFSASYTPASVALSGSSDGTIWTLIDTKTAPAAVLNVTTANTSSYKFYKFTFTGLQSLLVINEISAYSDVFSAPTLTAAAGTTGNTANISWTKEIRGTGSYELERSSNRVNFSLIKSFDQSVTSYKEDSLKRNTAYWYRIRAKKGDVYSDYSTIKEIITANDIITNAPVLNVTASATASSTASLSWSLPIGGPGSFELERSLDGTEFALIKTFDKAIVTYTDTTLTHNTSYWYRIKGKNDISTSPYSTVRQIRTINDALLTAPALQVSAPTGTQAILAWNLSFNTKGGFDLEKSFNGTDFILMGKVDKTVNSYTEESLSPNTSYWYRIRAYNYTGNSPYSAIIKVTTNGIKGLPTDITDDGGKLTVSAENSGGVNAGEGSPKLIDNNLATKWLVFNGQTGQNLSAVYQPTGSYVVTGYALGTANDSPPRDPKNWRFEGSDDNSAWTVLDTRTNQLGAGAERITLYNYAIENPGTKAFKFYRIAFTSNNGSTDGVRYQISEWQIFGLDPSSPEIPANLTASNATVNTIDLNWTQDTTQPVKGFILQRSDDGLYFNPIDTLTALVLKYTDKNLYDGATYYYRIKAIGEKSTAVSGWSNVATGKTLATSGIPLSPAYLTATAVTDTTITLKWADRSSDETGFSLERSRDNISFEEIKSFPANTTTYQDATVWRATYFYYRISAIKDKLKSAYSNVLKVLTPGVNTPPKTILPILPQQICPGTGEFKLAFNGVTSGPGYESIQKLTVTSVKAGNEESVKFFSAYSFDPVVGPGTVYNKKIETAGGIVNFRLTTTGIAVPGDSAVVLVTVKDDGGTIGFGSDSTEFPVKIYFKPLTVKITSDKGTDSLSRYGLVNLTASSNFPENTSFEWSADSGIEGSRNGIKLRARPTQPTTYTLRATTPNGCSATATITLKPQTALVIANVLTPNGDGKNETWIVWGLETFKGNEVKVFDRQGRMVFNKKQYTNDWDGSYNGSILPQGGYYYVVETSDGKTTQKQTGVLTIVK